MAQRRVKAWERTRNRGYLSRKSATREVRPRILIVCEGKKTEPNYFKGFKISTVSLVIEPVGAVHISVVERAIELMAEDGDYEEVWCVFDRDKQIANPQDAALFNSALEKAALNNVKIAYSNDAFELWYLLHFNYVDTQILRSDYVTKLREIMGTYKKNDPSMYSKIEDKMPVAIRNAKKLYEASNKDDPGNANPSTTVFKLVERLMELR
jgi:hypothetical protein